LPQERETRPDYTYRDPTLSLWQSAAAAMTSTARTGLEALESQNVFMTPVHAVASAAEGNREAPTAELESVAVVGDCAKVASQFLWAEIRGDRELAAQCAAELRKAVCDAAGWSTCLTNYLKFKAEGGNFPYLGNKNPVVSIDETFRIALVGDWGTGEDAAVNLLAQVKSQSPDLLLHLGDIYYSCTQEEAAKNFLDKCRATFPPNFPLFTLCGNHDMYSGGNGYYWLLSQIEQQASYFLLENSNWQLLAMDTGHNDSNPITVASYMTSVNPKEVDWLRDKIKTAGPACKTILLSHHQLFSPFAAVGRVDGRPYAYNPNLYRNFQDVLGQVAWWFWGHEHNLAVYEPYMGLERGRCVGCSAVPVFKNQQSYTLDRTLVTLDKGQFPVWATAAELGNNGTDYNHAFAILTLRGKSASVDYFEVPINQAGSRLWSEPYDG